MHCTEQETNIARTLAPEDIRPGSYVAALHLIEEIMPCVWAIDDVDYRKVQPIRVRCLPYENQEPMKVKAVCLPFVMVKLPDGSHRSLDVRQHQLAEISRAYGKASFKAHRVKRNGLRRKGRRK